MNKLSSKFDAVTRGRRWQPAITDGLENNEVRIRNIDKTFSSGLENFFKGFGKVLQIRVFTVKENEEVKHLTAYAAFMDENIPRRIQRLCQGVTLAGRVLRVETAIGKGEAASDADVKSPYRLSHLATIALATEERHKLKMSCGEISRRMSKQYVPPTGEESSNWGKGLESRWMRRWFRNLPIAGKTFLFNALQEMGMPRIEAVAENWTALQSLKANFRPCFASAHLHHPAPRQESARYDTLTLLF